MYLWEYLSELSLESLQIIAQRLDIESHALHRGRLAGMVDQKLSDRAYLRRMVVRLEEDAQQALITVLLSGQRGIEPAGTRMNGLEALLSRGVVYALKSAGQVMRYVVPSDVADLLWDFLRERLQHDLALSPEGEEKQRSRETDEVGKAGEGKVSLTPLCEERSREVDPIALVRDVFAFLSYVHRHEVQMTQQGRIHKRMLDKIAERLEGKTSLTDEVPLLQNNGEDGVVSTSTSTSTSTFLSFQGDHGPNRLEWIIQYCARRGLTKRWHRRLQTTDLFIAWLELPAREQMEDVVAYWLSEFRTQWPGAAETVLGVLRCLKAEQWVSLEPLCEVVCRYGTTGWDRYAQQRACMAVTMAVNSLWHMDMVRWGGGEKFALTPLGEAMLQGREDGTSGDTLISLSPLCELFVQPTFEIIVPKMFDLHLRFELERFATLVAADQMLTYRIDQESVYRGFEEGLSAEAMCSFLDQYSKTPIPQNVRYSIEDWRAQYGQISFIDVLLLRTCTPELTEEIKAHPQLRRFVKAEMAPSALVVDRRNYAALLKALRSAGHLPKALREEGAIRTGRSPVVFQAKRIEEVLRTDMEPIQNGGAVLQLPSLLPVEVELSGEADDLRVLPQRRMVERLRYALKERKNVLIDYQSEYERLIRKVRPLRVVSTSAVEAYCFSENAQRTFQISRIRRMKVLE